MTSGQREGGLARGGHGSCGAGFGAGAEPPDQAAGQDQTDRDQLRAGHGAAEDRAAAGIVAEIFEEESGDAVDEHERAE